MHLSLKGKARYILNIVPFAVFSHIYEKKIEATAKAEGLTKEEFIEKYYTIDNSDGTFSDEMLSIIINQL